MNALTTSLAALLAALIGIFLAQARHLLAELRAEEATDSSGGGTFGRASLPSDGRGVEPLALQRDPSAAARRVAEYVDRNEPFVCRNCVSRRGLSWWDDDSNLLEAIGTGATFPVRVAAAVGDHESGAVGGAGGRSSSVTQFRRTRAPVSGSTSAYEERNMTAADFFGSYLRNDGRSGEGKDGLTREHWYAAQIDVVSSLPGLLPNIRSSAPPQSVLLDAIGNPPPPNKRPVTLYLGSGARATQTHYDSLENVVCVLSGGWKDFDLFDPMSSRAFLYADRSEYGNASPVPPESVSARSGDDNQRGNAYPLAKFAHPSRVRLLPGDCLYLPVYWYHSVTSSTGRTVSVNWWIEPGKRKMRLLEDVFCGYEDYGAGAKCAAWKDGSE